MRVYGEMFLLINGWMDFLCLLLAARLGRSRFYTGKALISASLGGVYGMLSWMDSFPFLHSVPALLLWCLLMCRVAFGKRCPRLFPLVLAAGWLLSGLSNFVMEKGGQPVAVILVDSGASLAVLLLTRRIVDTGGSFSVKLAYQGKSTEVRAMRDTGNMLADSVSGLPVIVLPERLARAFMPPETNPKDLCTLPPGWRLLRVKTAAGSKALMCFTPDQIMIVQGTRVWRTDAVIAVSAFEESRALLPDSLFSEPREEMCHAVL